MSTLLTRAEVLGLIRAEINGSPAAEWARQNGVSQQQLSDVLNGNRTPGPKVLKPLGLEKVVGYRRAS